MSNNHETLWNNQENSIEQNRHINKQSVELSDLALENVEALARNESGKNNKALAQKANGEYCCTPLNGNNCTQSPAC